jgi:prepilin-type processing-associated H-X9-DG protein
VPCGFSLVEVLVVCGLISLLAGLLFPVFCQARRAAAGSGCLTHLRQLAVAFRVYASDYDDTFPATGDSVDELDNLDRLWIWPLLPYVKDLGVFHCPGDPITDARRTVSDAMPELWHSPSLPALSYGANWDLTVQATVGHDAARLDALPYPALTLLVADCSEPWAFGPVYTDPFGVRWSHIAYANAPPVWGWVHGPFHGGHSGAGQERHGMGSNIAYADGHVGFLAAARFELHLQFEPMQTIVFERPILGPEATPP